MEGRDIISVSRTGSGKTLGFLLPIFEAIRPSVRSMQPQRRKRRNKRDGTNDRFVHDREPPQALVLAPTRELAVQIEQECRIFGRQQGVRSVAM
jgi:superfamily II DNA/RNA helicase